MDDPEPMLEPVAPGAIGSLGVDGPELAAPEAPVWEVVEDAPASWAKAGTERSADAAAMRMSLLAICR